MFPFLGGTASPPSIPVSFIYRSPWTATLPSKFSTTPLPLPAPRQLAIPQTTPPLLPHRKPLLQPRCVQLSPLILDLPQRREQPPQPRPLHSRHRIINPSPILPRLQNPRRPQRPQMPRQIRLLHLQRIRQLAHARLPFEQRDRQPQPRLIRQRLHQLHRRLHNEYMSICSYINRARQSVKQNFLSHSRTSANDTDLLCMSRGLGVHRCCSAPVSVAEFPNQARIYRPVFLVPTR